MVKILLKKKPFKYIVYVLGFGAHLFLGHLNTCVQNYGHLKLNGLV